MDDVLRVIAVLLLVAGNAFFVIGEYAVVTARRAALVPRAEAGGRGAQAALRLMDDPVRVISTVQVGITAIGILIGAIGEPVVRDLLGEGLPDWAGFVIAFGVVTYLSVVVGELVPKALTLQQSERLAIVVARPVEVLARLLRPVVWLLQESAALLLRPFGIGEVVAGDAVRSADELRALVDEAEGAGVIPRAQEELLHNVFDFASREARDVMVPAPEVSWLDADQPLEAALDRVLSLPYGRYPVARGGLDNLVGIVHVRELVAAVRANGAATTGDIARPAFVVPETKDLGALLREQQEGRHPLAIVVDEYGGTSGVVSIEDIIEELVGEIRDEFDLPDATMEWLDERTVRVAGSLTIDDFDDAVGTHLAGGTAHTLAGLAFDELGRRPREGDVVTVGDVVLRVEEMQDLRISALAVRLPQPRA